jgi:hypothetical protein
MNDIDQKIQAALQRDPAGAQFSAEPNLAEEAIIAFRGRHRWVHGVAITFIFGFLALIVWAAFRFLSAEVVRDQLIWGGLAMWAAIAIGFLKIWFWLEMHSNRVLREIKRVELLLISRSPSKSN